MNNYFNATQTTPEAIQYKNYMFKYLNARSNILLVVIFSVLNIVLLLTQTNSYFLFSAFIPYVLVDLGMFMCGIYPAEYYADVEDMVYLDSSFLAVTIVIAMIIIGLYLLSWIFTKKLKIGWMIFALAFFSVDTIAMLTFNGFAIESLLDILFHGWVIFSLVNGIINYNKLSKLPAILPDSVPVPTFDGTDAVQQPVNSTPLRMANLDEKFRVLAETEFGIYTITYRRVKKKNELVINGNVYDEYEALIEASHCLYAIIDGHQIEAGYNGSQSFINIDGNTVVKKIRWY